MNYKNEIKNLSELFIKSAEKFSARNSLILDDLAISYQNIFERASRLACSLLELEADHCALLSARGIDSFVGLLAILMAGKVYVPLSIKSPQERNLEILKFSQATVLIVDEKCIQEATELLKYYKYKLRVIIPSLQHASNTMLKLNHDFVCAEEINNKPCLKKVVIQDDAYLLFTSGSTGIPKAVMTSHASIIEYINKMSQRYKPNEYDRFSQLTDLSFDVAMHEIFLCWANGACLYVITGHQLAGLHRVVNQYQLTFWTSVPSVISLLKQSNRLSSGMFPSIRYSILLGEALTEELANSWHRAAPNSKIDNLYGPTEATIIFTGYRWRSDLIHPSGYVPIGKPMSGQEIAIVDEDFKQVPQGSVGELYLAGTQVAKGYWNNPELTKEKFVHLDRIFSGLNKLWYKTGDYVYWDDVYGLIFKGRDVDMLKVRGGRIERLEVEMALRDIAQTNMVAIVPFQTSKDGVVLNIMAFVGHSLIENVDILKHCRRKLPEYMIPSKVVRVESLPFNKNGKIDYPLLKQRAVALLSA